MRGENDKLDRKGGRLLIGINLAAHGWREIEALRSTAPMAFQFLEYVLSTLDAGFVDLQQHDLIVRKHCTKDA